MEHGTLGSDQEGFHPNSVALHEKPGEQSDAKSLGLYRKQPKLPSSIIEGLWSIFIASLFRNMSNFLIYQREESVANTYARK